jgi:Na+/proline symporter
MVATTFAADTPLLVTELVVKQGISGNWIWWNGLIGGMLTVFFFAPLWRRAGVQTDVELLELRYGGRLASYLRGFRAVYLGLFLNAVVMAWVNLALASLLEVFFGLTGTALWLSLAGAMLFVLLYSGLSGLLGVVFTDFLQFWLALAGCIALAYFVLDTETVGGLAGLRKRLPAETLSFFPKIGETSVGEVSGMLQISFWTFLSYIGVQWWASWYPGAEPGGGGYVAQRMMAAKSEGHAVGATLFFQVAHYALRPWPWVLVALAVLLLYPELPDGKERLGYAYAMRDFLPSGWRGLLLVAFLAAYMSTISTQLNWGASYLVNDLYQRYFRPEAKGKQLVQVARAAAVLMAAFSLFVTSQLSSLQAALEFLIACGAGLGGVLILRWYWWRVSVWSEFVATLAPFLYYSLAVFVFDLESPFILFFTAGLTTITWLVATLLLPPESEETLRQFFEKVQPTGPGWKRFGKANEGVSLGRRFLLWFLGLVVCYGALFGLGEWMLGDSVWAAVFLGFTLLGGLGLRRMV